MNKTRYNLSGIFYNNHKNMCVLYNNIIYISLRLNHSSSISNVVAPVLKDQDVNKDNNYNISWTKDFKNLNRLLSNKSIEFNKDIDINHIKYLIFTLNTKSLDTESTAPVYVDDLFYSLRLVVSDFKNGENSNSLYEKIIENLTKNSSIIKDGGTINIYYVSSNKNDSDKVNYNYLDLSPTISKIIYLNNSINNKELRVNIFLFSYDSFFRGFVRSDDFTLNFMKNRSYNNTLWNYPFLIIEDMNLPTVTYLFKERGINFHGMSITRRHKLSPLEENLSIFLYVTDLNDSVQNSHICYSDELFTSNKIDFNLYKEISKIQEFNFNITVELYNEINNISDDINNISNDIHPSEKKFMVKNKLNLVNKFNNNLKSSMNPLVIILLKRNLIFELEKRLNDSQGLHKDLLSLYDNINLEIDNLIKLHNNKQDIIKLLNIKIKDLELEITKIEEKISQELVIFNENKEYNKVNKNNRRVEIKSAKNNKDKKKIRKKFKTDLTYNRILNEGLMRDQNYLSSIIKTKKDISSEILKTEENVFKYKNEINKSYSDKNELDLKIKNSNDKIDSISKDVINNSNYSFSGDFIKNINLRKKNIKNSDLISKNNKREYSTLNIKCFKSNNVNNILKDLTTNPMYVKIIQIFKLNVDPIDGIINNIDKQFRIENTLKFFWNLELNKLLEGKKSLFSSYVGINILLSSISKLEKVFNVLKRDKRYFSNKSYKNHIMLSNNGIIISIVLSNIIPHMMKYKSNQNTASLFKNIGIELHKNLLNNEWSVYNDICLKNIKSNENSIYSIKVNNKNYEFKSGLSKELFHSKLNEILGIISNDDFFKLGCDLSEIISENTELFKFINIPNEDNTVQRIIVPGLDLEDQIVKLLSVDLEKLPMICEPSKWEVNIDVNNEYDIVRYGGYLLNRDNKNEFINGSYINNGKTRLNNYKIIECINYLSSIQYIINKQQLDHIFYILEANELGVYDNPKINDLIKLNIHPKTKELYNLGLKNKFSEIDSINKHNSQYYSDKSIITKALLYSNWCDLSDDNSIYFNYFIDWRGRLYNDSTYLSTQGGDLSRSLILFKKGQILTDIGLENLKVYTANNYGLNKLSYNKRLKWVDDNWNKIMSVPSNLTSLKMDDNIKDFYNFVLEADEPWLFLSCCIELKNYELDKKNFKSRLPVYLDATCSGLQHLSTMINDANLAKYVNIKASNKDDIPSDVYSYMIDFVIAKIREYINDDITLSVLSNIKISRKLIKPGIMTISYGATARGIANNLMDNYFKVMDPIKGKKLTYLLTHQEFNNTNLDLYLTSKQIYHLGKAIHSVLYEVFPDLTILVQYLKEMNAILKKLNLPTIWLTPSGLIIEQKYAQLKKKEIVTSVLGKRKSITINMMINNTIDLRKQNSAIVPNIVHSFDASNIALLVERLTSNFKNNYMDLITIHDCFATNANDVEDMKLLVKFAFIALYSNKLFIEEYNNFILDYIRKTGYIILEQNISGDVNRYVSTDNKNILLPKLPNFSKNKNLKLDILGSEYFIN